MSPIQEMEASLRDEVIYFVCIHHEIDLFDK
jgi:hypothetical protein